MDDLRKVKRGLMDGCLCFWVRRGRRGVSEFRGAGRE